MAKRYTQKQKDEVVQFIKDHDREQGRGGKAEAAKAFGINPITIKKWCDAAGIKTAGKSAKKLRKAAATGVRREGAPLAVSSTVKTLKRMHDILTQVEELTLEYNSLKSRI